MKPPEAEGHNTGTTTQPFSSLDEDDNNRVSHGLNANNLVVIGCLCTGQAAFRSCVRENAKLKVQQTVNIVSDVHRRPSDEQEEGARRTKRGQRRSKR